jgi:hypothetical protein
MCAEGRGRSWCWWPAHLVVSGAAVVAAGCLGGGEGYAGAQVAVVAEGGGSWLGLASSGGPCFSVSPTSGWQSRWTTAGAAAAAAAAV